MYKNINIIFYFPYKKVGGVSILFLEIAKLLSNSFNVYLVDFLDGYMGSRIPPKTKHIHFDNNEYYPNDSILVLQSTFIWRLKDLKKFPPTTKVLFWNLHPDNFSPLKFENDKNKLRNIKYSFFNFLLRYSYFYNKKYLDLLEKHNSIWFMDESNYNKTHQYYPNNKLSFNLLPCFFPSKKKIKNESNISFNKVLNFVTIGRLVDFKVHILNHLILRLNSISNYKFKLTIIGDGEEKQIVLDFINQIDLKYEICFIDELNNTELGEYIYDNCDILFAMGLSSLEGASRRIPTILLDYSFNPLESNYRFKLIYEHQNYNLGTEINNIHFERYSTFEKKIGDILENYDLHSEKCYYYWLKNYSEETFLKYFDIAISKTTLTIEDLYNNHFQNPDFITKLYFSLNQSKSPISRLHGFRYPTN